MLHVQVKISLKNKTLAEDYEITKKLAEVAFKPK